MKATLVKKTEGWYNLYQNDIGIGSTYAELQGYKLSLKCCQAIERGYDLDELAIDYIGEPDKKHWHPVDHSDFVAFKDGFEKALELMGDKNFSEDDMIRFMQFIISQETLDNASSVSTVTAKYYLDNFQSLQQTEWDVEIVEVRQRCHLSIGDWVSEDENGEFPMSINGAFGYRYIPKLDADGCLILRKK